MKIAADGDRPNTLRRLELTEDEARAVEHMWNWPALRLIADERVIFFADNGYGALETLDALWHGLDGVVGHTYLQHGFTPHQGFLIHTSETASHNMWGPDRDIERVHRLLGALMPQALIAVVLLEANSPEEAERQIVHFVRTGPDYVNEDDPKERRLADMLETDNASRVHGCDCRQPAAEAAHNK